MGTIEERVERLESCDILDVEVTKNALEISTNVDDSPYTLVSN